MKDNEKYERITVYLTAGQKKKLTAFAKKHRVTASLCVREALAEWGWKA